MLELIFWVIFTYFVYFYIYEYMEKRKSPPGPLPIPILGNLIQLALADPLPSLAFAKFAKRYGEVFQVRMGMKTMIVPTTVESITTLFSAPEAQGRDVSGTFSDRNFNKNYGMVMGTGSHWIATKKWTIRGLRELGFGKSSSLEASASQEIQQLFQEIDKTRERTGNIVPISDLFVLSTFNNVWKLVAGQLDEKDMPVIHGLLEKNGIALSKGVFGAGLVVAYPFVRHISPEGTGHKAFMDFFLEAHKTARGLLTRAREKIERTNSEPETLVESFVCKMKEEKNNPETIFTEKNFICIYMDLMQAGSDTVSSYLESFVLFMVLYPDVQEKFYREITKHIKRGEKVSLEHRQKMIYAQACMLETHRHAKVVQNLVTREITKSFYYKKYLIKKGTIMIANLHAAYFSKDIWADPESFSPERFIGENGEIINQGNVMPFGFGRRVCPGEGISHSMIFLYSTTLLQKYKLSCVPGKPPKAELAEGFTSKPYPFEIVFTERL